MPTLISPRISSDPNAGTSLSGAFGEDVEAPIRGRERGRRIIRCGWGLSCCGVSGEVSSWIIDHFELGKSVTVVMLKGMRYIHAHPPRSAKGSGLPSSKTEFRNS